MAHQEESLKSLKLRQATDFYSLIGSSGIRFLGVSGSVSYEPSEGDDVDIFIICKNGRLWRVLLKAFLIRRKFHLEDVCISLTMDETFALNIFGRNAEYVVASDSVHVIPLFGDNYYNSLLSISPFVKKYFPQFSRKETETEMKPEGGYLSLDLAFFILLAPYLIFRSWRQNKYFRASDPAKTFEVKVGLGHFYFDSVKYNSLKQMNSRGGR